MGFKDEVIQNLNKPIQEKEAVVNSMDKVYAGIDFERIKTEIISKAENKEFYTSGNSKIISGVYLSGFLADYFKVAARSRQRIERRLFSKDVKIYYECETFLLKEDEYKEYLKEMDKLCKEEGIEYTIVCSFHDEPYGDTYVWPVNEIKNIPVVVMSYYKVKIGVQYNMKV